MNFRNRRRISFQQSQPGGRRAIERAVAREAVVMYESIYDGEKDFGKGGASRLYIDDALVGEAKVPKTPQLAYSIDGMDVGWDVASRVSVEYPEGDRNRFNGRIVKVVITTK